MRQPPSARFLGDLARSLFDDAGRREQFVGAFSAEGPRSTSLIWRGENRAAEFFGAELGRLPWEDDFVSTVQGEVRPGQHSLHAAGEFYCLDPSSVFEGSVLRGIRDPVHSVLDLCASPGGKSVYAWRRFRPCEIVANEVIKKRLGALSSNLQRMRLDGARIASSDVSFFASASPQAFDLVVADVPCSGQSLVLKGTENPGGFHPRTIKQCAMRQRRIISNASACVRPGGHLAYMTCTFSKEENEEVIDWFLSRFPHFQPVDVPSLEEFRSPLSERPVYRLWPWQYAGAGGFTALLRRQTV